MPTGSMQRVSGAPATGADDRFPSHTQADHEPRADTERSLAVKLNHLFQTVHPSDRGPYSNEEVASAIRRTGESMSATYLWLLRRGERTNPTMRHVQALACFFRVTPAYFFDDALVARTDDDLRLLATVRELGVWPVALRTVLAESGLSAESQLLVQQVIDRCLALEKGSNPAAVEEHPLGPLRVRNGLADVDGIEVRETGGNE
ncbi:MAG TPA: XRE family transcriptional regulator [Pilimelia sp.]|nr:XRE family transcriptional regulator [Pilimelia sp.]